MNTLRKIAAYVRLNADVFAVLVFATLLVTAIAGAAGSFTSAANFWASGPVPATFPKPGFFTTYSGGNSYLINNRGTSPGGFIWTNTVPGAGFGTQLMQLDANGALHAAFFTGTAFTSSSWATQPTNCGAGFATSGQQINGNVSNCMPMSWCVTADDCGELSFNSSQTSNTYTFTGTPIGGGCAGCFTQHPECTSNLIGAQNTWTFPIYGGCGGSPCTITLKAATVGVTASASYICRIRP